MSQDNVQVTKGNITLTKRIDQLTQTILAHAHDLSALFI